MVLDIDVGPMLQTHKLMTSVLFAREGLQPAAHRRRTRDDELDRRRHRARHGDDAAGHARTGADLELLPALGYERNPVAIRHNTVAKLLAVTDARMDCNSNLPGAKELAAAF